MTLSLPEYSWSSRGNFLFVSNPFAEGQGLVLRLRPPNNAVIYTRALAMAQRACEYVESNNSLDNVDAPLGQEISHLGNLGVFATPPQMPVFLYHLGIQLPPTPTRYAVDVVRFLLRTLPTAPTLYLTGTVSRIVRSYGLWQAVLLTDGSYKLPAIHGWSNLQDTDDGWENDLSCLLDRKIFTFGASLDLRVLPDLTELKLALRNLMRFESSGHQLQCRVCVPDLLTASDEDQSTVLSIINDFSQKFPKRAISLQFHNAEPEDSARLAEWCMRVSHFKLKLAVEHLGSADIDLVACAADAIVQSPFGIQRLIFEPGESSREPIRLRSDVEPDGPFQVLPPEALYAQLQEMDQRIAKAESIFDSVHECGRFLPRTYPGVWLFGDSTVEAEEIMGDHIRSLAAISRLLILEMLRCCGEHEDGAVALKCRIDSDNTVVYTNLMEAAS
jgi:hypothetical protein